MSTPFIYREGQSPIVVSFPHQGVAIPSKLASAMSPSGQASLDTDWYVRELYDCLEELDATIICAHWSRYVVDLNRAPNDQQLYAQHCNSSIVPVHSFAGVPLYKDATPTDSEVVARIEEYWLPYHSALAENLERIKRIHGYALLWDAHSIRGEVPELFVGRLPELNFGTNNARSAALELGCALAAYAETQSPYSSVLNGRFTGGYITRHYGKPQQHVHAVQLEMNQQIYLRNELQQPPVIDEEKAARLAIHLRRLLRLYVAMGKQHERQSTANRETQDQDDNTDI